MIPANKTVEIYYLVDEFLKEYDSVIKSHSLEEGAPKKRKKRRNRKFTMSNSEIITILILFHSSSFRNLKHFYLFVRTHMQKDIPYTASYNRFVELQRKVCIPLAIFLRTKSLGNALVFLLSILHSFEAAISKEKSSINPLRKLPRKEKYPWMVLWIQTSFDHQ